MARIILYLSPQEKSALLSLAEQEFREPRSQAALIIRNELERIGLLPTISAADRTLETNAMVTEDDRS